MARKLLITQADFSNLETQFPFPFIGLLIALEREAQLTQGGVGVFERLCPVPAKIMSGVPQLLLRGFESVGCRSNVRMPALTHSQGETAHDDQSGEESSYRVFHQYECNSRVFRDP